MTKTCPQIGTYIRDTTSTIRNLFFNRIEKNKEISALTLQKKTKEYAKMFFEIFSEFSENILSDSDEDSIVFYESSQNYKLIAEIYNDLSFIFSYRQEGKTPLRFEGQADEKIFKMLKQFICSEYNETTTF